MDDSWRRLLRRAEAQYGVFTMGDARRAGVAAHQVWHRAQQGELEFVHPGVLRVVGVAPYWLQRAQAAMLWLGPTAAISHTSAARLQQLDGRHGDGVHAWVPNACEHGRKCDTIVVHRTLFLPDRHRLFVDGIACTTAARTVIDLAPLLDGTSLTTLAESARRLGLMTISELERTISECGKRRRGAVALRRYIETHSANLALDSRLEVKAAALFHEASLPGFKNQYWIRSADGRSYRVDFAWPELRVVVECDGFRWHGNHAAWKRDRRRIAALERAGWRVCIITWDDVTQHPAETVERIRLALADAA